ncbi:hypothetical protein Rs2_45610 [Raphanus sativus]|nr:hypothetical protein Rs2_45610 [Raphanus sativus]
MSHSMVFFSDLKSSRCSSVVEARLLRSSVLGGEKYRELMWVDMLFLDVNNKDEDRVVKNNEGLPQPFLGSCNDRARQLQASSSGIQSPGGSKESDSVKVARGVKAVSRRTQSLVERFERRDTITLPEER